MALLVKSGTIVHATILAFGSTKNQSGQRDPQISSTKKGNAWPFGMRAYIGVDAQSGQVHRVRTTTARVQAVTVLSAVLHGEEQALADHSVYGSMALKARCRQAGLFYLIADKAARYQFQEAFPRGLPLFLPLLDQGCLTPRSQRSQRLKPWRPSRPSREAMEFEERLSLNFNRSNSAVEKPPKVGRDRWAPRSTRDERLHQAGSYLGLHLNCTFPAKSSFQNLGKPLMSTDGHLF